ncbi:hypothetical protein OEZ78_26905, partial [Leclercia adecarboxylata]|uniref:cobaltochelatase subunit CobN n=1 Tax=Leclercia adecarboxylata TaxID=83655 RepID=UPI00234D4C22
EEHNPTAQAQLIERMVEAIRKGYWDASEDTRRELTERWQVLTRDHGADTGEAGTREFIEQTAVGYGPALDVSQPSPATPASDATMAGETVRGRVMQEVAEEPTEAPNPWRFGLGIAALLVCLLLGEMRQAFANRRLAITLTERIQ